MPARDSRSSIKYFSPFPFKSESPSQNIYWPNEIEFIPWISAGVHREKEYSAKPHELRGIYSYVWQILPSLRNLLILPLVKPKALLLMTGILKFTFTLQDFEQLLSLMSINYLVKARDLSFPNLYND